MTLYYVISALVAISFVLFCVVWQEASNLKISVWKNYAQASKSEWMAYCFLTVAGTAALAVCGAGIDLLCSPPPPQKHEVVELGPVYNATCSIEEKSNVISFQTHQELKDGKLSWVKTENDHEFFVTVDQWKKIRKEMELNAGKSHNVTYTGANLVSFYPTE